MLREHVQTVCLHTRHLDIMCKSSCLHRGSCGNMCKSSCTRSRRIEVVYERKTVWSDSCDPYPVTRFGRDMPCHVAWKLFMTGIRQSVDYSRSRALLLAVYSSGIRCIGFDDTPLSNNSMTPMAVMLCIYFCAYWCAPSTRCVLVSHIHRAWHRHNCLNIWKSSSSVQRRLSQHVQVIFPRMKPTRRTYR